MKKICMIGAFPPPVNGLAVAFENLAEAKEMKEQFCIFKVDYAVKNHLTGLREILYKIYFNVCLMLRFKKLITDNHFDIFYLNLSTSNRGSNRDILLTNLIKRYAPYSKLVLHHHGGSFQSFYEGCSAWRKRKIKTYLDAADIVIALTEKLSHMFRGVVDDAKIRVVSNGIKESEQSSRRQLDKKFERIYQKNFWNIVYFSNMVREKGFMKVLEAAKILKENGMRHKFNFIFAGAFQTGKEEKIFQEYIEHNQLGAMVGFKGVICGDEKRDLLYQGDILVLPTELMEGQPIAILEAMAAGMSVITTDYGGIPDLIKDGYNGKILKEVTASCIADTILAIADDRNLMEQMGKNNINEVNGKYLEKYYIKNMINIFREVIDDEERK